MNFDRRGQQLTPSTPKTILRTVKKTLHIDSADRDSTKYYTCGDIVIYLPRVYERVVSLRLMSAEFPGMEGPAFAHSYSNGQNNPTTNFANDVSVADTTASGFFPAYFLIDIEGLNRTDETAFGANGSGMVNGFFAKISTTAGLMAPDVPSGTYIYYNDHSAQENIGTYSPPISKLDRMHIRLRTHDQQDSKAGFIYWTNDGNTANPAKNNTIYPISNFSLTFEIEYIDNGFDNFSSYQTGLTERS